MKGKPLVYLAGPISGQNLAGALDWRKPQHLDFLKFNEACNDALGRVEDAALAPKEET